MKHQQQSIIARAAYIPLPLTAEATTLKDPSIGLSKPVALSRLMSTKVNTER